ncbi:MAG: FAD:protein FMN transferase [Acidimicrobiales bacterium]
MSSAPYWAERWFRAMGSSSHLIVGDADDRVIEWAVAEIERLEQCWSRFRPNSELSLLNAQAGVWVAVSPTLLFALTRARDLWRATEGCFDPTVLDALERFGYDRSFDRVEVDLADAPAPEWSPVPGFKTVDIDVAQSRVRSAPGVRIDLGGVGKGLAADVVAEGLVDRGARTACISLGGDIRVCGDPPEPTGWRIPVEDPFVDGRTLFEYPLAEGAIVTSTRLIRRWSRGGRAYHHIIDPTTGAPSDHGIAAVVVAGGEAWWAEGFAKAAMVAGIERGRNLLKLAGLTAWIFRDDGSIAPNAQEIGATCTPN